MAQGRAAQFEQLAGGWTICARSEIHLADGAES
jgi:hypothetical protein